VERRVDQKSQFARLPDGQLVKIETIHEDGYATLRRVEGEWQDQIAVCAISKLEIAIPLETPASKR
jgi:hypothetical protein